MKRKARVIAFYLPQFYPTKENDEWWEPGFTEWTNVVKAKPLFRGHYQPRIPRDLGFYDLRVPETRQKQVDLARVAGIDGFCYWHYWFAGRRLLDRVFREVLETGMPNFPFCLCWANHSWYAKTWDPQLPDKLLIEQTYPGEKDYINHFNAMLPAFMDNRYMRINGKLIFGIFEPLDMPSINLMKNIWNDLAEQHGLGGFYFFGLAQGEEKLSKMDVKSYDAIVYEHMITVCESHKNFFNRLGHKLLGRPYVVSYNEYVNQTIDYFNHHHQYIPCLIPNFDHSPRSFNRGRILHGSTPEDWEKLCKAIADIEKDESNEHLLFIKSWNEWGEGNYLEPDSRFGIKYIEATYRGIRGE